MTCRSPPRSSDTTQRTTPPPKSGGGKSPGNLKTAASTTPSKYKHVKRGSAVEKLLNEYDTGHGYFLTHLDTLDRWEKVLSFIPNLFYNGLCSYIIYTRILRCIPIVIDKVFLLRPSTCHHQHRQHYSYYVEPIYIALFHAMIDWYLITQILPSWWNTARAFFYVRLCRGFRKTEIIFRKPTLESIKAMSNSPSDDLRRRWEDFLRRAVCWEITGRDPGCFSEVGWWVLEWDAVHAAYEAAEDGSIGLDTWQMKIWRKVDGQWRVWDVASRPQPDPWPIS
ncbi:hypothetical protein BDN72DRAFT_861731 [Pluteus cervinus]|uniref:Uncharacterized protein n=1 Tax=Pluteus cervinus TaxID=181527 RepID=A0ACD3AEJ8_9AGAR|nr:hypothetical protein BDN72DRAFT_861731 [Pluteus cervinus]